MQTQNNDCINEFAFFLCVKLNVKTLLFIFGKRYIRSTKGQKTYTQYSTHTSKETHASECLPHKVLLQCCLEFILFE